MFFGQLIKHETIDSILGRMDGRKIRDERKKLKRRRKEWDIYKEGYRKER